MNINIDKNTIITLTAWATVLGFLFLLFGQIGGMRADINNLREDVRELRKDNREIRQIFMAADEGLELPF